VSGCCRYGVRIIPLWCPDVTGISVRIRPKYAKTPASTGDKPQAASPVTVIGKIIDNKSLPDLKKISDGDIIELRIVE
jgi:hypothetical protein